MCCMIDDSSKHSSITTTAKTRLDNYCKGGHHHKMGAGNWDHHPGDRRFITNFKNQKDVKRGDDGGKTEDRV